MAQDQAAGPELLSYKHIFGLKGDVSRAVHFVEEALIMYPCGHKVVFYNTETREQELIHGTPSSHGITALSLTPNRKYVAAAEKSTERGFVTVYDAATQRRRKILQHPDMISSEIVHVAFSADSKLCLTQGGAPDWLLVVWSFDRTAKPVATYKTSTASVYQADFCPQDSSLLCATGDGTLKFLRVAEGQLKTVQHSLKREPQNYLCHCWLPEDRFVVVTDTGDIYLFEGFEFRLCLQRPLKTTTSASHSPNSDAAGATASQTAVAPVITINIDPTDSINSIMAFSKGFVCGCANGVLCVFERSDDDPRELFKCSKVFRIADACTSPITNLAVSPSEESLCCSTKDAQLYTFTLSNTDILKDDATTFDLLTTSFHGPGPSGSARINGIDVCIWKPIIVTCGDDRTLRVWNYRERSVELVKQYDEDVLSVALHPSGLYALAGFADKIRLVSLLLDNVRTVREISVLKGCRECSFSHGGHLFAIANHSVIQVFNTYTCETTAYLRGHTGKVRSIRWAQNDRKIVTAGSDGAVFVWKVREGIKDNEQVVPRLSYQAAVATPDVSKIFTLADDDSLREHSVRDILKTKACDAKLSSCVELSSTQRLLFVGCGADSINDAPGAIQVHAVINNWEASSLPTKTYQCSAMELACLKLSRDGSLLFAGGNDGSLCMFEVHDIDQRGVVRARTGQQESAASSSLSGGGSNNGGSAQQQHQESGATICVEEILVTKSDISAKSSATRELGNKVEELTLNNDYQLRLKDMKYKDRITEMTDKFSSELEADASRCDRLADEKRKMEEGYEGKFKALEEKHKADYSELEQTYEAKIVAEVQRYQLLLKMRDDENAQREEENRETVDAHSATVKKVTADFEAQIKEEQETQKALAAEKESMTVDFEKTKDLVEADADMEVVDINVKYEAKLSAERKLTEELKGENDLMKKRHASLTKDVDDQKEEIRSLHDKEKELLESIKGLEKDIQGHKKEIREREETIADKEKRIYDLKKKNQELEKFKFVLDYKIKELKRQIEPRETEITDMRKQVEEMDVELDQYHKSNSSLDLVIGELRLKMDGMQKEIDSQKLLLRRAESEIARFRRDLAECAAYCLSPSPQTSAEEASQKQKELKGRVRDLYAAYVLSNQDEDCPRGSKKAAKKSSSSASLAVTASQKQQDVHIENNRQREHLERSVNALKRKIARDMKMYVDDRARLVDESTVLTEDINALRIESHDLELKERTMRERRQATRKANETISALEARIEMLGNILKSQKD